MGRILRFLVPTAIILSLLLSSSPFFNPVARASSTERAIVARPPLATPASQQCATWNLTADFRVSPNQENPNPDSCGTPNVWYFMSSAGLTRDPQTYSLMSSFVPNLIYISGLESWQGTHYEGYANVYSPHVSINTTGATQVPVPPGTVTLPPNAVFVHPGPAQLVVVGWRSPIDGNIAIRGSVSDLDPYGGDGILWYIDKGSANLASGGYSDGGVQDFRNGTGSSSLESVAVYQGEFIYFVVHPKGGYYFDTTKLDVSISTVSAPQADLSITKSASPNLVTVGNNLTYTLRVRNNGPSTATGVVATDTLPANVTFASANPGQGSCSGTTIIVCDMGTLANGDSTTVTITVKPTTIGTLFNTATVSGNGFDPNTSNNSATVTSTVVARIDLTPLSASLHVGDTHTLVATITTGGTPPAGVSVSFMVGGVNPTSGTATTDARGKASFSYRGTKAGKDTVVASAIVNGQSVSSNTAQADWTTGQPQPDFSPAPIAGQSASMVTLRQFLGPVDQQEFVRQLKLMFDVYACTSDAAYIVYPVVASEGAAPPNPVPPNMAQHCASAFGPILELIDRHLP